MRRKPIDVQYLEKMVSRFEELDRELLESLQRGTEDVDVFVALLDNAKKAKLDIKSYIAQFLDLHLDGALSRKLKKIRDNHGYNIDGIYTVLGRSSESLGAKPLSQEYEEIDFDDAVTHDRLDEFLDPDQPRRRREVGALICWQGLPPAIINNLERLKECYVYGLYEPTIVFCRAIIEVSVYNALEKRGLIELTRDAIIIKTYAHLKSITKRPANAQTSGRNKQYPTLRDFMKMIEPHMYKPNYQDARKVIRSANDILHAKRKPVSVVEQDAYNSVKTAFAVVEELYG